MTVTLSYTDYLGNPQSQSFTYLYVKGLGTPDKFRLFPPLIYKFPDGSKKTAFKGFKRVITVALAAQTANESFLQAFLWAAVKTVAYTDPVIGAVTATCVSESREYEAEWIDEFSLTKRYVFELVESTLTVTAWSGQILIDSYPETNQNGHGNLGSTYSYTKFGMGFTGNGRPLASCKFYLKAHNSPTGNVVARLYAHTGTFGTSSEPTGTALATSDNVATGTIPAGSPGLVPFTFSTPYTPVNGTRYVITCEYSGPDGIYIYHNTSKGAGVDNESEYTGAWGHDANTALCFYCYGSL